MKKLNLILILLILNSCEKSTKTITSKYKTDLKYWMERPKSSPLELDSVTYYKYYKFESNRNYLFTTQQYFFCLDGEEFREVGYYTYKSYEVQQKF